jgi:acetyl-CoA acetyltransferase
MGRKVYVVGVGMTKFEKPGSRDWDYPQMVKEAAEKALADAKISYKEIEQAVAGYCYGESTSGERALYEIGLTGVPIYNVNNNCSTGSTALFLAKQLVEGGLSECVMAVGFEKMEKGSLGAKYMDRVNPMDKHMMLMMELREFAPAPPAPQIFGNAGREHMEKYGTTKEQFAKVGHKNHKHSVNNPYSQFQDEYSLDDILSSKVVYDPLTKLQCCPTSDGAGVAILASAEFVKKHGLQKQAIEIAGMAMSTDLPSTFEEKSCIKLVGFDMTKKAAERAYEQAGVGPENVNVIELHDCFSTNELLTYEALGLCEPGKGGELIDSGAVTYGGQWVVNPSGGLISKGHPLGATGLAQCSELNWQLRGQAEKRQVDGAKIALQHNLGLGGAAVVTIYRRAELLE